MQFVEKCKGWRTRAVTPSDFRRENNFSGGTYREIKSIFSRRFKIFIVSRRIKPGEQGGRAFYTGEETRGDGRVAPENAVSFRRKAKRELCRFDE